jgi:hypothetical protein
MRMRFAIPTRALRRVAEALALAALASCNDSLALPSNTGPLITLTPISATIAVGDSAIFSVTGRTAETFRWTAAEPAVAAVSAAGVVRGLASGRSLITVWSVARPSVRASALVTVQPP